MAGRILGLAGEGAVPQHPTRKGRAGPGVVIRIQPADQITREVRSDGVSPRSVQEFQSVGQSRGPDPGGAWPEELLGCNTVEAELRQGLEPRVSAEEQLPEVWRPC